jgi:multicomponent Na+:H+ antiporter subunit E
MTTGRHNSLGYSLLLNVLLAFLWQAFQPESTPTDFVVGAVVGFVVLAIMQREYGRRVWAGVAFAIFLGYSIIASSLQVAGLVLARRPQLDRGIIAIPLEASSDVEIAALATAITLTPGTISVDVQTEPDGQRVLYVHNLVMGDPDEARKVIKRDFEQRILRFTRSA